MSTSARYIPALRGGRGVRKLSQVQTFAPSLRREHDHREKVLVRSCGARIANLAVGGRACRDNVTAARRVLGSRVGDAGASPEARLRNDA